MDRAPIAIALQEAVIEVADQLVEGHAFGNNNRWYHDRNGWYYWSGGATVMEPSDTEQAGVPPLLDSERHDWLRPDKNKLNWGVHRFNIDTAWWKNNHLSGKGVSIALLGTGVNAEQSDIKGAIRSVFNIYGQEEAMEDFYGLGHQSAVVAAGNGFSIFGVAPQATLLIGKVGRVDQDITPESIITGIDWALEQHADIIGVLTDFRELDERQKAGFEQRIEKARSQNTLLLAPVGNSTDRRPTAHFPAALDGFIAVGAHDSNGERCLFSAKSYKLDVLAPGEDLLTVNPDGRTVNNIKTTAISVAFLAGLFALAKEHALGMGLTSEAWLMILRNTARAKSAITKGNDVEYGYGILNPAEVLASLASNQKQ